MSVVLTVSESWAADSALGLPVQNDEDDDNDDENAREAELVVFDGTTQGLGLKICGGCSEDGQKDVGIFIRRVLQGGLAELQGGLEEGDLILDVNGQNMEGVTYERALSILRQASASNHVEMVITRDEEAREMFQELTADFSPMVSSNLSSIDGKPSLTGEQRENDCLHQQEDWNPDSSVSSCHSDLAQHFSPASPQSFTDQGDSNSNNLRSLRSVLTHSFPQAVHSLLPSSRFPVTKLEVTLQSLGFVVSAEKHLELMKHISVDSQGFTSFDDFVRAVKHVFHVELQTKSNSECSTPPLTSRSPGVMSPAQLDGISDDINTLQQEKEYLLKQVESLKEELQEQKNLCQKAEEQVMSLRKESQASMEESRSLRTKLCLAEQSQEAARKMEQDYEQVVTMLESEVSHLRLHISKSDGVNEQRRLAVAACQLKKTEQAKKTYEVSTNKLLEHVQHVQEVLSSDTYFPSNQAGDHQKGGKQKWNKKATQTLLSEGQDVIRSVQTLIEQVPLPFGWEENYTADGVRYYINHLNQTTSWTHPSSNVEYRSGAVTVGSGSRRQQPTYEPQLRLDIDSQDGT